MALDAKIIRQIVKKKIKRYAAVQALRIVLAAKIKINAVLQGQKCGAVKMVANVAPKKKNVVIVNAMIIKLLAVQKRMNLAVVQA